MMRSSKVAGFQTRADSSQVNPVKLLTLTALKPTPPAAVRLIRKLSYTLGDHALGASERRDPRFG